MSSMVILAFTATNGTAYYFAGPSVNHILAETNNGLSFGGARFKRGFVKVPLARAKALGLLYLASAQESVQQGTSTCYLLGVPAHLKQPKKKK